MGGSTHTVENVYKVLVQSGSTWKNNTRMFLAEIRRNSVDSTGSGYRQVVSS